MIPSHPLWTDFKTLANEDQIKSFALDLFHVPDNDAWKDGKLDEFRLNLFARVVEADEKVVAKFGNDCIIHLELIEKARRARVSQATLKEWGRKATAGFALRNKAAEKMVSGETVAERVEHKVDTLLNEVERLRHTANVAEDKINNLEVSVLLFHIL
jgi:hypothetical protein